MKLEGEDLAFNVAMFSMYPAFYILIALPQYGLIALSAWTLINLMIWTAVKINFYKNVAKSQALISFVIWDQYTVTFEDSLTIKSKIPLTSDENEDTLEVIARMRSETERIETEIATFEDSTQDTIEMEEEGEGGEESRRILDELNDFLLQANQNIYKIYMIEGNRSVAAPNAVREEEQEFSRYYLVLPPDVASIDDILDPGCIKLDEYMGYPEVEIMGSFAVLNCWGWINNRFPVFYLESVANNLQSSEVRDSIEREPAAAHLKVLTDTLEMLSQDYNLLKQEIANKQLEIENLEDQAEELHMLYRKATRQKKSFGHLLNEDQIKISKKKYNLLWAWASIATVGLALLLGGFI